jgi:hypothetical protein
MNACADAGAGTTAAQPMAMAIAHDKTNFMNGSSYQRSPQGNRRFRKTRDRAAR